jgi:hypothetical protein
MGPKVPNELKESAFLHFSLQYYIAKLFIMQMQMQV